MLLSLRGKGHVDIVGLCDDLDCAHVLLHVLEEDVEFAVLSFYFSKALASLLLLNKWPQRVVHRHLPAVQAYKIQLLPIPEYLH